MSSLTPYLAVIFVFMLALTVSLAFYYIRLKNRLENPYREGDPRYQKQLFYELNCVGETLAGFKVPYTLELRFDRVDNHEFNFHRMLDLKSQDLLATSFNTNRTRRRLEIESWFFHYRCDIEETKGIESATEARVCGLFDEKDGVYLRELHDWQVIDEIRKEPFEGCGCKVYLEHFEIKAFNKHIIERNYNMLSNEQKAMILQDDRFGKYEEMLAVAALRRRLDFLDNTSENHDSELFSIATERIGRGLRIKWRFKPEAMQGGYDIVGFRRTGGFFADRWDETNNGTLVIHSNKDGETLELLKEGEAQFYTFFLKPWQEDAKHTKRSPLRFQMTIAPSEETDAIKTTLERIERQSFNPPTQNVSRALRELGLSIEFDKVLGNREKVLAHEIKTGPYTEEEKEEKLSRLREVVAAVRDKYQQ